jgi:divalent metal cation (Fe/Co/Zn/Cd) transporter
MLTMHFGPREVLVTLSLEFAAQISATDVQNAVSAIERRIRTAHPEVSRVFVESQSFLAHRTAALARVSQSVDAQNLAEASSEITTNRGLR